MSEKLDKKNCLGKYSYSPSVPVKSFLRDKEMLRQKPVELWKNFRTSKILCQEIAYKIT